MWTISEMVGVDPEHREHVAQAANSIVG